MNDRLEFGIDGVKKTVEVMKSDNANNRKNKEEFLSYIDSNLVPEWNTFGGVEAVAELKEFVNGKYQDYINYLDDKIVVLEEVVIPALQNIYNA